MKAEKQKILDKIRKLMGMAERTAGNEAEAAIAAKMAETLLRKHNLSSTDVTIEEAISDIREDTVTEFKWTNGSTPEWVRRVAITLAKLYDTHVIPTTATTGNDSHVQKLQVNLTFVGSELDATVTKEMFLYLYKTINRLTEEFWGMQNGSSNARTIKNSFREGASFAIKARILEIIEEKNKAYTSTGTGLIVVKKDAIEKYLGRNATYGPNNNKGVVLDSNAYHAGIRKGEDINLNNQITSIVGVQLN